MRRAWLALLLCACGATQTVAAPRAPRENRWASMSWEARHERMTFAMLPSMATRLREFRGTEEAELACVSCHGMDAEAVDYRMPRGLPALDPAAMPEGDVATFMADVVVPAADRIMRAGGTTTCFTCHPRGGA